MQRISIAPRDGWRNKVEELGLIWHTTPDGIPYWAEDAYYKFTPQQIEKIENATNECYRLFLEAGEYIVKNRLFDVFGIPREFHQTVIEAWEAEPPALNYGRFDFGFDGVTEPKLLEFNCDTPTSLLEASVIQWNWKDELFAGADQFNGIHEAFVAKWKDVHGSLPFGSTVYFVMSQEASGEDAVTTAYMADMAKEAGIQNIVHMRIDDIGWDGSRFLDLDDNEMRVIYKLYPWEWLVHEEFGQKILMKDTIWIEPIWKMIWSSKAILPILSKLFPNHPNILKAAFEEFDSPESHPTNFVRKPILSREGANVSIFKDGKFIAESGGDYGEDGFVFQELFDIPSFDGNYPIIGSWVVDGEACGMGIREGGLITDNVARFVPHVII